MQLDPAPSLPRDMAVLGVVELVVSFVAIYALVEGAGDAAAGSARAFPLLIASLPSGNIKLAGVLSLTIGIVAATAGLYRSDVCRNRARLILATAASAIVAFGVLTLLDGGLRAGFSATQATYIAKILAAWLCTVSLIRLLFGMVAAGIAPNRRILVVGYPRRVGLLRDRLRSRRGRPFDTVAIQPRELSWRTLHPLRLWGVVVASDPEPGMVGALLDCKLRGIQILSGTAFQERHLGRIDLDSLTASDLLVSSGFSADAVSAAVKRLCDVAISIAMLLMTLPLMLLTALAIKADSPGPVLYRQQRSGAFDKPFTVFKFRSMTIDAEAGGKPRWAQKQDPRVTRIGRFIRATRIDELPQLANVISGEMSLVGPRPERPHFVEQLARDIPFYRQRGYVKPGLTGWAQVNYPYGASVEDAREKLAYDLYYVKHRSFLLDLRILLSTVRVVLFREGSR